jgi:hypothetical protein
LHVGANIAQLGAGSVETLTVVVASVTKSLVIDASKD